MTDGVEWRGLPSAYENSEPEQRQRFTSVMNGGIECPAFVNTNGVLEPEQHADDFTLLRTALDMGRPTFKTWTFAEFKRAADYAAERMAQKSDLKWIQVDPAHWRNDLTSEEWRVIANSPK